MFHLRELERKDLPSINKWRNDPELIALLGAPFRYINLDVDVQWFESYMGNRGNAVRCAITEDNNDDILGLISLVSINYMNQSAELHIMIGAAENQGRGIGTYAVKAMLSHAFYNMNLQRIELGVLDDNIRAKHLYEKCGFVYEGRKRKARYKNGEFVDILMYSILKSEFTDSLGGGRDMIPNLPRWMIMDTNGCSEIDWIVRSCDVAFESPVSRRVIYPELLAKIGIRGNFFFAVYHGEVIGYCAFYRNDLEQKTGYISLIGVVPKFQKMHVGTKLLNSVLDEMYSYGMRRCLLEVRKNNENAIQFYKSNHFIAMEDRVDKYLMKRDF